MNGKHQLTAEGLEKCKLELETLKNSERPRIIELLKEAREQGDLSENADYDSARDEQARLESRIKELENIVKNSAVISSNGKASSSNLGRKISIKFLDHTEKLQVFTLVSSSIEASTALNDMRISTDSPIGAAVLHAKVGDQKNIKTSTGKERSFIVQKILKEDA